MVRRILKLLAGFFAFVLIFGIYYTKTAQGYSDQGKKEVSPAAEIQAKALNRETESLYRFVEEGNTQAANESLRRVERLFETSSFQGLTGVEGVHALAESIIEMKETAARVQLDPKLWMIAAGKLRLAADSLAHPKDGIWLQYYKVIREDIQLLDQSAAKQDRAGLQKASAGLQEHYEMIRPALIIVRKPEEVTMIESWLSYVGGAVSRNEAAEIRRIAPQGEVIINLLFGKKKDEPALAPLGEVRGPWMWQLLFAAFILSALTFTGYRKYKGHKNRFDPLFPKRL